MTTGRINQISVGSLFWLVILFFFPTHYRRHGVFETDVLREMRGLFVVVMGERKKYRGTRGGVVVKFGSSKHFGFDSARGVKTWLRTQTSVLISKTYGFTSFGCSTWNFPLQGY